MKIGEMPGYIAVDCRTHQGYIQTEKRLLLDSTLILESVGTAGDTPRMGISLGLRKFHVDDSMKVEGCPVWAY